MTPSLTMRSALNRAEMNAQNAGNLSIAKPRMAHSTNIPNGLFGEFGHPMPRATRDDMTTLGDGIGHVVFIGSWNDMEGVKAHRSIADMAPIQIIGQVIKDYTSSNPMGHQDLTFYGKSTVPATGFTPRPQKAWLVFGWDISKLLDVISYRFSQPDYFGNIGLHIDPSSGSCAWVASAYDSAALSILPTQQGIVQ